MVRAGLKSRLFWVLRVALQLATYAKGQENRTWSRAALARGREDKTRYVAYCLKLVSLAKAEAINTRINKPKGSPPGRRCLRDPGGNVCESGKTESVRDISSEGFSPRI